jgi:hypothetical protein
MIMGYGSDSSLAVAANAPVRPIHVSQCQTNPYPILKLVTYSSYTGLDNITDETSSAISLMLPGIPNDTLVSALWEKMVNLKSVGMPSWPISVTLKARNIRAQISVHGNSMTWPTKDHNLRRLFHVKAIESKVEFWNSLH